LSGHPILYRYASVRWVMTSDFYASALRYLSWAFGVHLHHSTLIYYLNYAQTSSKGLFGFCIYCQADVRGKMMVEFFILLGAATAITPDTLSCMSKLLTTYTASESPQGRPVDPLHDGEFAFREVDLRQLDHFPHLVGPGHEWSIQEIL
jgi:hypothetical protein